MFFIPIPELENRRAKLASSMPLGSYIFLKGSEHVPRNRDVEYQFRQESNFWYFTGINQANCSFLITKSHQGIITSYITCQVQNSFFELWNGKLLSVDQVMEISGVDEVVAVDGESGLMDMANSFNLLDISNTDAQNLIRDIRLIKSEWEIEKLRTATKITKEAHEFAYRNLVEKVGRGECVYEYEFQADMEYIWAKNGCTWAYYPIVAGGERGADYLHYFENNQIIDPQKLLLVDAACEFGYYASDITRTYPPTGTMSVAQSQIHNLVTDVQSKIIEYFQSGGRDFRYAQNLTVKYLGLGLLDLKILSGTIEQVVTEYQEDRKNRNYDTISSRLYNFFPHGVGHFMGLDVHDIGSGVYDLKPGMVITVEPGLYFHSHNTSISELYRGIGVRIEDDIVITETGAEML
jgi:Xaa-Pro aminopeptidase